MADISKNIRTLRLQKNMSQATLAEALGVTRQTVSNWERGSSFPDIAMVEKLAQILGTEIDALLYPQKPKNTRIPRDNPFSVGFVLGSCAMCTFLVIISGGFLLLPVLFGYIALCAAMICDFLSCHLAQEQELSTVEWLERVHEKKTKERQNEEGSP